MSKAKRKPWTLAEESTLKDAYKRGGVAACLEAGIQRTHDAIRTRALTLGVHSSVRWSDEETSIVRKHFAKGGAPACRRNGLKDRTDMAIFAKAAAIGQHRRSPAPDWTTRDVRILREHYARGGAKAVVRAGVMRSDAAIRAMAHKYGITARGAQA